eukprot:TRINITY_DN13901_c0_g1_i1.p1 TRINITY_DN13901_c0_g1~~TRINITY_DN13901_c0_g1_i1.p1  ORF type:complete len:760 (+),score=193.50 TRINITY_DN13901_c0_g1_i1:260-2281(+)
MTQLVAQMHQATGKGTWAFTPFGTKYDMGNWQLCEDLDNTRYCSVYSDATDKDGQDLSRLLPAVGVCVPNTCGSSSLSELPRSTLVKALGLPFSPVSPVGLRVECRDHVGAHEMPWGGYVLCSLLTMLAAAAVVATIIDCQTQYDVFPLARALDRKAGARVNEDIYDIPYDEDDVDEGLVDRTTREFSGIYGKSSVLEGTSEELSYLAAHEQQDGLPHNEVSDTYRVMRHAGWFEPLMAFSAARNTGRLIAPPPVANTAALNGIRVLSMCWVVLGHTYVFVVTAPMLNISSLADATQNLRFHLIYGGFFAVDSFFLMSGFLVAYLFLLELKKHGMRRITMPLFYFHRIWRIFPTVLVGTLFYWQVMPYVWTTGPFQPAMKEVVDDACDPYWWSTLLFFNNFVDKQCAGWLWYMANDMQFFVLSPIILLAYWKKRIVGIGIAVALIFMCILANMLSAIIFDLEAFPMLAFLSNGTAAFSQAQADHTVLSNVYMLPWTRCAPYLVGILTAFLLLERQSVKHIAEHSAVRYSALAVAGALLVLLTFVTYTLALWGWTKLESMIWLGFSRTSWAIALGVWMFYFSTGHGGAFNRILSHNAWIPFARLSFGCYMYHLIFMTLFYYGFKAPIQFQLDLMMCFYVFNLMGAFMFAYINYLLVEKPMMNYEKLLLGWITKR